MDGLSIKLTRIQHGIKQWELAQRAGLHPTRLSLIENGRLRASDTVAARIQEALRESGAEVGRGSDRR